MLTVTELMLNCVRVNSPGFTRPFTQQFVQGLHAAHVVQSPRPRPRGQDGDRTGSGGMSLCAHRAHVPAGSSDPTCHQEKSGVDGGVSEKVTWHLGCRSGAENVGRRETPGPTAPSRGRGP